MTPEFMHFIRPLWLLLLPLAVLLPWAWKRTRQPAGDWARVCDPHLLSWLSVEQSGGERRGGGYWLAGLGLALAILALAGPSWQKLPDASYSARDARVVVLDLSRSMLAEDLRPNRLTRARFRLSDLLERTREGQVGLVAFAGDAYVVSPLTNDMNTIANLLPALRPDIIPVAGSRADLALVMAAGLLERSGLARGEILLVTDSVTERDTARARDLSDDGIAISVLAVGTGEGAPIPAGGGFVTDRGGNVVIAKRDRAALQALARAGGGNYTELNSNTVEAELWGTAEGSEFGRRDDALGERWKDAGPWLVLLLIPLALAGFRRGLFFLFPLLLINGLVLPADARADWWDDLWLNKDQQAYRALRQQNPDRAAAVAEDPALAGEAWYRKGEFPNAIQAWSGVDSADGHYNRGNALAQAGDLDGAIAAYDRALEIDPEMWHAMDNREKVQEMKEQQEQQERDQQGESGENEQSEEPQEGEPSEEQQDQDQQESGEQEGEEQPDESEARQPEQQADVSESWSEEDAQAMEQWLRRIPDDPGGLLRRKFRYQHQQRGAPEDENETW